MGDSRWREVEGNNILDSAGLEGKNPPPWEANRLVTWWEMEQFSASGFYYVGFALENLKGDCHMLPTGGPGGDPMDWPVMHQPLSDRIRERAKKQLATAERHCRDIGLNISADTVAEIVTDMDTHEKVDYVWLLGRVTSVQKLIGREMAGKLFLYIPPDHAKFWPTRGLPFAFGEQVNHAFPSATFDISEAAICLALRRPTASVFHLMRVLEWGLSALCAAVEVAFERRNWGPVITEVEKVVTTMHEVDKWKRRADRKELQESYAQAVSYLGVAKEAWRNYTMHSRAQYTDEQAEVMFANVKLFMGQLSVRLSERPEGD